LKQLVASFCLLCVGNFLQDSSRQVISERGVYFFGPSLTEVDTSDTGAAEALDDFAFYRSKTVPFLEKNHLKDDYIWARRIEVRFGNQQKIIIDRDSVDFGTILTDGTKPPRLLKYVVTDDELIEEMNQYFELALPRNDSSFADAETFKEILSKHGFVVRRVFRSTFQSFGRILGTSREAAFETDEGSLEVLFFPAPDGAERVNIKEEKLAKLWQYTFPGHARTDLAQASDTLFATNRQYFVRVRKWFVLTDSYELARKVRQALSQR